MRVLIDLTHPADAHQFRRLIGLLKDRGHRVLVTARDKDVTHQLLEAWQISFVPRKGFDGLLRKGIGILAIDGLLLGLCRRFKPDALLGGTGNLYIAQTGWLARIPCVIYDDTEHSRLQNWLTFPFAAHIITPESYSLTLKRQIRLKTYKELFYLHPSVFAPDTSIYKALGISPDSPYTVVRFISWGAGHDVGARGMRDPADKRRLIRLLNTRGPVFISSEGTLPPDLEPLRLRVPPDRMHDALAFAAMVVTEGATVAAEAAVLGVPAVYVNSLPLGYLRELQDRYRLVECRASLGRALPAIQGLLATPGLRALLEGRRQRMLAERIDGTTWLLNFLESVPKRTKNMPASKPQ